MALTKEQKKKILEDLKEKIERQKAMIFVDFIGLKVKDLSNLRKKLRAADNELKVVKKTLLGSAFKERDFKIDIEKLKGELAIIFGFKDGLSPAKIIYQFSQENPNLKILGGFFEKKFREAEEIITLAQLPTREELLAKLAGTIFAPVSNLAKVLEGNIRNLIYIISQIKPST
ncbi:MAG: 50S ribosomal protein L10 [Candidatus Nealsonbacteria bacterium]|nr:MAG: 50S ribosomal protein L10 [Candidatus Nealsonbacteria bacterium]